MEADTQAVGLRDIEAAASVIAGRLHRTPVMGSTYLGGRIGADLAFKLELFQKTGSFKPRGVLNNLHNLSLEAKEKGVISLSAGNHAQALAWAASQLGIAATIVMPAGAVQSKIEATQGYGGEVMLTEGNLLEAMQAIQAERGLTLVHPFDDPNTIAGQGTVGLEIMQDAAETELVVVGVGGGGLISGIATAVKGMNPGARVVGVEPEGAAVMAQSLEKGEPVHTDSLNTIADGLAAPFVGEHNLKLVQAHVDEMVAVSDEEILEAMRLLMQRCKVVPEPAGAAGLAGLLSGAVEVPKWTKVVCVVSGGNVDLETLKSLL